MYYKKYIKITYLMKLNINNIDITTVYYTRIYKKTAPQFKFKYMYTNVILLWINV